MMEETMKTHSRPSVLIVLFLFLLGGIAMAPLSAQSDRAKDTSVYFGLMGGYGHSESQGGMADLKAEVFFPLSGSLSLGLGFGYLSGSAQRHGMGYAGLMGGMMGGMMNGQGNITMGIDHSFRSTPLTLTAYLRRPISHTVGIVLLGGFGYYWGRYQDVSVQTKEAFGPHFGLGADFRIARNVLVVGETSYRFVRFEGFQVGAHPGFDLDVQGHPVEGFWYFDQSDDRYHFRLEDGYMNEFMSGLSPFDISLNGLSLRAGLRFGF
jgi:hypothetical protein